MVAVCDGMQTHTVAEHLLMSGESTDTIRIGAYSFDHPIVAEKICEAVKAGATVKMTINYNEVYGQPNCAYGKSTLKKMMRECAGSSGRLELLAKKGYEQIPVYAYYDRALRGSREKVGAQHAKLLYLHPFLLVGSTNWSVSSETNRECSCLHWIGGASKVMIECLFDRLEFEAKRIQESDLKERHTASMTRGRSS